VNGSERRAGKGLRPSDRSPWDEPARAARSFYVVLRGPLGVGKSTVAGRLSTEIRGEHVRIDRILEEHGLEEEWEDGYLSQRSFLEANRYAAEEAGPLLGRGLPVVLDGNFYWRSQIEDLVARLDFRHLVFTLKAPLSVCIERDRHRVPSHGSDAAREVYAKATEFDVGIVLDATRSVDAVVGEILGHLARLPGGPIS
jgi:predicted kinase